MRAPYSAVAAFWQMVIPVIIGLVFFLVTAVFADRKNRAGIGWGIFAFFFGPIPLVILAFCSFLCPRCHRSLTNQQAWAKSCPNCEGLERQGLTREEEEELCRRADDLLERACKEEISGNYEKARGLYAEVSKRYPGTTFAEDAQTQIEVLKREGRITSDL